MRIFTRINNNFFLYMKRDPSIWKVTHAYEKLRISTRINNFFFLYETRPIQMKGDPCIWKETHTYESKRQRVLTLSLSVARFFFVLLSFFYFLFFIFLLLLCFSYFLSLYFRVDESKLWVSFIGLFSPTYVSK